MLSLPLGCPLRKRRERRVRVRACTEGETAAALVRHPPSVLGPARTPVGEALQQDGAGRAGFVPAGAAEVQGAAAAGNELVKMKKGHK